MLLMVVLNYIYSRLFYEKDLQAHSGIINIVRNAVNDSSEIVYLGESSNISFRADDLDKRPISEMISDYFPSLKFGNITKEASHAGIYYELINNIPEDSKVKTVIVTMNLRSFNAQWIYSNLETPLQKSMVLIKDYPPLFNRLMLSFKGYDVKSDHEREMQFKEKWANDNLAFPFPFKYKNVIEWDYAMANNGIKNPDGSINYSLTELACHYIKGFAFHIDTIDNPRIKDFDRIVELAKKRNWNLVFNLMAEDVQMADSLVGRELIWLYDQNRKILKHRYNKERVFIVDNLEAVSHDEFIDKNWTTEHYAEKGRRIIAANVAETLKKIYPSEYTKVEYKTFKPRNFFNDCEGTNIWGQMQTLSSDKAYSGVKSSKTGKDQDFGLTFEYPVSGLPDSLNSIDLSFQIMQAQLSNEAKLAIELIGEKIGHHWEGFFIKDLTKETNKWSECNLQYNLPPNYKDAEIIKIYILNPTENYVYADDIRIKFL